MAAKSSYLANALLNHTLRNTSYVSPSVVYLALYTSSPTAADTGAEISTSGTAYVRQSITFAAASAQSIASAGTVTYPQATSAWGTITHWGIRDAGTGGNLLYYGAFDESKTINLGDQLIVSLGQLSISET